MDGAEAGVHREEGADHDQQEAENRREGSGRGLRGEGGREVREEGFRAAGPRSEHERGQGTMQDCPRVHMYETYETYMY